MSYSNDQMCSRNRLIEEANVYLFQYIHIVQRTTFQNWSAVLSRIPIGCSSFTVTGVSRATRDRSTPSTASPMPAR
jgi:hypothetical protein